MVRIIVGRNIRNEKRKKIKVVKWKSTSGKEYKAEYDGKRKRNWEGNKVATMLHFKIGISNDGMLLRMRD